MCSGAYLILLYGNTYTIRVPYTLCRYTYIAESEMLISSCTEIPLTCLHKATYYQVPYALLVIWCEGYSCDLIYSYCMTLFVAFLLCTLYFSSEFLRCIPPKNIHCMNIYSYMHMSSFLLSARSMKISHFCILCLCSKQLYHLAASSPMYSTYV